MLACALVTALVLAGLAAGFGAPLHAAQEVRRERPPAQGLSLEEAIGVTLEDGADIRLAAEQVKLGEGDLLAAQGAFDAALTTDVTRSHVEETDLGSAGLADAFAVTTDQTDYVLGVGKQFRTGLTVRPEIVARQSKLTGLSSPPTSTTSVDLRLGAPLLANRWGKIVRSTEEAAKAGYEADRLGFDHQRALSVLDAAAAYWNYLGAHRELEVLRSAEKRAQVLVEETRQLVDAEERPAADLNQVLGNAASKRIDRIQGEQRLTEARSRLGIVMGIPASAIPLLPAPSTDFPEPRPFEVDAIVQRLVQQALGRRADLRAARQSERSAELAAAAAEDDLKPTLDLSLSVGYSGLDGGVGADGFFGSVHRNVPGVTAFLELSYRLQVDNAAARGLALQRQALDRQQQISRDDLERTIQAAVEVAAEDVMRSARADDEAQGAVDLNRKTVENEKLKNRLGLSTLFDVIFAEDRLTSSLLASVDTRLSFAVALARLRFETGALAGMDSDAGEYADSLMSSP